MPACALGLGLSYPQQVATSPQSPPPPPPVFSPSDLWLGAETGGWWDLSKLSTMTIARDGTGASPLLGEPAGFVTDQGPNGLALEAFSDSSRPVAVNVNGQAGLRFDGLADFLRTTLPVSGPTMTTIVAATNLTATTTVDGLVSLSSGSGTSGTFHLVSAHSSEFRARVRTTALPSIAAQAGPTSGVFCLEWNATSGSVTLRNNGSVFGSSMGYAGNLVSEELILAADRKASAPLACDLGAVIHIGRALTPTEITLAETWAAARLV